MISNIERRLSPQGAKRILSLDGGGVRGLITLGYLEKIESLLTEKHGRGEALHLHEYFDLIGGTSTGAVIATLLCLGKRPSEIKQLYLDMLPEVFKARRGFWRKWRSQFGFDTKFDSAAFSRAIDDAFREVARDVGRPPELLSFETDGLKTGLAIFAKRIDTGSAWVQTNNPRRKFWTPVNPAFWPEGADFFANRDYSLKTLVQASAAAPYFVDPVEVSISPKEPGLFIDGGVSPHNNPSKELFLMTTLSGGAGADGSEVLSPHGFGWQTGADDLLMISVGTGYVRPRIGIKEYKALPEVKQAVHALRTIISDADTDAVTWMQAISRHEAPWPINFKLGDMTGLKVTPEPLLSFQRYNQTIEEKPLTDLMGEAWAKENLGPRMLGDLREFDVVTSSNLERLVEIGAVAAEKQVKTDHFPAPFDRN